MRHLRVATAAVALAMFGAATAACEARWVRVFVEGLDPSLTAGPVDVQVALFGGGHDSRFTYNGHFVAREETSRTPSTDFLVDVAGGAGDLLDVRVRIPAGSGIYGGDDRIAIGARGGADSRIEVTAGEFELGATRLFDGDLVSAAPFGNGLVFAWPAPDGVVVGIERDLEQIGTRARLVAADRGASQVRIASRPGNVGVEPDLYAIVYRRRDGGLVLQTFTPAADNPPVDLDGGDDVQVACSRSGSSFEVATTVVRAGVVWATLHDLAGRPLRAAFRASVGEEHVRAMAGLVAATQDNFLLGTRSDTISRISRVAVDGSTAEEVILPGSLRALVLSPDTLRALAALVSKGQLEVRNYFASTLTEAIAPQIVAPFTDPRDPLLAHVALSRCAIVWPEARSDGSGAVDLRLLHFDFVGNPVGDIHGAHVGVDGDYFAPTAVCHSQTRAFTTFVHRPDPEAATGTLFVRHIPAPSVRPGMP